MSARKFKYEDATPAAAEPCGHQNTVTARRCTRPKGHELPSAAEQSPEHSDGEKVWQTSKNELKGRRAAEEAPAAPTHAPRTFQVLALADIVESPTNPRKDFDVEQLAELAADVKLRGVLQPVLVRIVGKAGAGEYELVFGHRRFRAAKLAGLEQIPAMVTDLSDAEVLEVQLVENAKRSDLSALEVASAYQQLHKKHGLSVEQIAEKVSRSASSVRAALKLVDLVEPARKALEEGKLSASTALLIARVPAKQQADVLKEALGRPRRYDDGDDDEPMSYRALQHLIQREHMLQLAGAHFDPADAQLVKAAGACTGCPHRTGSQPDLFSDVKGADVCTNLPCFRTKESAWLERKRAEGAAVLPASKAKEVFNGYNDDDDPGYNSDYVRADKTEYGSKKSNADKVGAEKVVLAKNPKTGSVVALVPKSALPKERESSGNTAYAASQRKWKAANDLRRETQKRVDAARLAAIEKKLGDGLLSAEAWKKLALLIADEHWTVGDIAKRRGWEEGWKKRELLALKPGALQLFVFEAMSQVDWLAQALGVDEKKLEKTAEAEVKAELKAKAAAKKSKGKKGRAA